MQAYLMPLVVLVAEMAPYLLLGFLIAGLLHAFVPRTIYARYLAGNDFRSVFLAALFGVPLPLCSCGVIPTAMSMRREGASHAATVSFLIATPQTGVDSIAATASLLGLPFALLRPLAALVTALGGGALVGALTRDSGVETTAATTRAELPAGFGARCVEALKYGFGQMMQDIGKWLVVGLVIAGAITVLVPDGFFAEFGDRPLLNMLLVLAVSAPMYLCATGSVPIAAALMLKGLSPGAAFVLLMAGPATNMAAILVIGKVLGRKTLLLYLLSIIVGAMTFGLGIDYLLPREWFTAASTEYAAACCVVMASKGYPTAYEKGFEITLPELQGDEHVFIAGAKLNEGKLVTSGGRVLGAVTVKPTLKEAIDASYGLVDRIHFDNAFYRRDIGQRALAAKEEK